MTTLSPPPHGGGTPRHPSFINTVKDFRPSDRPLLSFIALSAAQSSVARSAEVVLDAALMPPTTPSSSESLAPSVAEISSADRLSARYPEVRVLLHLHYLRCALRDLQECPTHARRTFFSIIHEHLAALALVLPEPLFTAIAAVLQRFLAMSTDEALAKDRCHVLEVQLMHIVEATQTELLRATKQLSTRAGVMTLRFHHDIPYL
ncbi:conserved hypothetical protein [Leishmania major strain Friedlin]|uniref:Uncharacterized protein n=1 Tax=Leishmania major TaxID=5664 RepID=Q4Q6Z2_LEIMA|nr:conserved hypothetical protein [Leishmania major strain Friedlin]CAG9578537.1 hypothetical_protein_-_conserved [Leishmania major strain Friedlin]CAJ06692.2 conserved hypothetical protein [Leishmania major strain Friedlin]|eukprot:XP_001684906.2 conserved hypothetical protein [Leishmania major strain Friedlin]